MRIKRLTLKQAQKKFPPGSAVWIVHHTKSRGAEDSSHTDANRMCNRFVDKSPPDDQVQQQP